MRSGFGPLLRTGSCLLLTLSVIPSPAKAASADRGDFTLVIASEIDGEDAEALVREQGRFGGLLASLNGVLALPADITVRFQFYHLLGNARAHTQELTLERRYPYPEASFGFREGSRPSGRDRP